MYICYTFINTIGSKFTIDNFFYSFIFEKITVEFSSSLFLDKCDDKINFYILCALKVLINTFIIHIFMISLNMMQFTIDKNLIKALKYLK